MKKRSLVKYLFHPVGQGLFASGHLTIPNSRSKHPDFSWVYDCGTTSSKELIHAGLARLKKTIGVPEPVVDLVIISHFDNDHISGIVNILENFHVRTLIIPLAPLWQRLSVLFQSARYVDKRAIPFYLDPVAAISKINGARIERIVLIPPSEGEAQPMQRPSDSDGQLLPSAGGDDAIKNEGTRIELTLPPGASEFTGDDESTGSYDNTRVYKIRPGESLSCSGLFEFVPYNDTTLISPPSPTFVAAASDKAKALLDPTSLSTRKAALNELKRHYEAEYNGPYKRNAISLYMYAGPLGSRITSTSARLLDYDAGFECACNCLKRWCRCAACFEGFSNVVHPGGNFGANIIYSGDGFLSDTDSWKRLTSFFGSARMRPLLVFQVMHHGASANWRERLGQDVGARFAIFSSDPTHKRFKHPHDCVVDDFTSCSQVAMVNKKAGFALISSFA